MSNRSTYTAATAAVAGGALLARRRARLRRIADGIRDTILPSDVPDLPGDTTSVADEAHAPGHRHLPAEPAERGPRRLRGRPWTKHVHGMRHPYSAD